MKKKPVTNRYAGELEKLQEYLAGTRKLRTTLVEENSRKTFIESGPEAKARRQKAQKFKELRVNTLDVSQESLATAIRVSPRTVQGWERGANPVPGPVEILLELMTRHKRIRQEVLAQGKARALKANNSAAVARTAKRRTGKAAEIS